MDLKGWQDTKRRQNIEVSIDYLQNIQVSNSIVYIHTACVIDNISVYIADVLTAQCLGVALVQLQPKSKQETRQEFDKIRDAFSITKHKK